MIHSGLNQLHLRENNLANVILTIQSSDNASRASVAQKTGLMRSTITKLVNQLIAWDIVHEMDTMKRDKGRNPTRLSLNTSRLHVLATSINRDKLRIGVCDLAGNITSMQTYRIQHEDARQAMDRYKEMVARALDAHKDDITAIGISVPGLFDSVKARIKMMSGFPGWEKIDIAGELAEMTRLPIYIEQNVCCAAYAEMWFGKEKERYSNMLLISSDRGLGSALVRNGEVFSGSSGLFGEVGHMSINMFGPRCECGSRGCLEMYASAKTLERVYLEAFYRTEGESDRVFERPLEAEEICHLVNAGDPIATAAFDQVIHYLSFGLLGIIHVLDPRLIVFASKLTVAGPRMLQNVREYLQRHLLPSTYDNVQIAISDLAQENLDLLGAAAFCFSEMFKRPTDIFDLSEKLYPDDESIL